MPEPLTDAEARRELRGVQSDIEAHLRDRKEAESDLADIDVHLADLRKRERALTDLLTPERKGVPRVIRKGGA